MVYIELGTVISDLLPQQVALMALLAAITSSFCLTSSMLLRAVPDRRGSGLRYPQRHNGTPPWSHRKTAGMPGGQLAKGWC